MKAKLVRSVKKVAAVATGALFIGATMGMASVFAQGLSSLPGPFVSHGAVNAVVVVGASAATSDVLGAIDIASALTAAAAATHSSTGSFVTIGTYALHSQSHTSIAFAGNDTQFGHFNNLSVMVDAVNFTNNGENYTSIENVSFSSSVLPYINGLNVALPSSALSINSYVKGISTGHTGVQNLTDNFNYLIGTKNYTITNYTGSNITFGSVATFNNLPVPSSKTVGTNTVNLIVGFKNTTSGAYEVELNINGKANQYAQTSHTTTVDGVTLTLGGLLIYTNGTTVLSSLAVSSPEYYQNITAGKNGNVLSLGPYNVTTGMIGTAAHGVQDIVFTLAKKEMINSSFTAANSFALPSGLPSISLQKLTSLTTYQSSGTIAAGYPATHVVVSLGNAGVDRIRPVALIGSTTTKFRAAVNVTHGLPNVAFGTDFRSSAVSSGGLFLPPDYSLEHYQTYNNGSISSPQYVVGQSEYIFPAPAHAAFANDTTSAPTGVTVNSSLLHAEFYNLTSGRAYNVTPSSKDSVGLLYQLPNGIDLEFFQTPVTYTVSSGTGEGVIYNITGFANFTAGTVPTKLTPLGNYSFNGYNMTVTKSTVKLYNSTSTTATSASEAGIRSVNITGPVAELSDGVAGSVVPGFNKIYVNGVGYSTVNVTGGLTSGNLGTMSFSGTTLTYTSPYGDTQSMSVAENKTNFKTYDPSPANTTSTPGISGAFVNDSLKTGANFVVPSENYTLALSGSEVPSGSVNYSVGSTLSSVSGKVLGIGGVSSIAAKGLTSPSISELDSSFAGATNSVPVIVVGGSAINTLGAELLNSSTPVGSAAFTTDTGVGSGEALIEMYGSVKAFGNQPALWVAGYGASDTLEASEVLAASLLGEPVVSLTGNKVILSTSSASYTGVSIVSTNSTA